MHLSSKSNGGATIVCKPSIQLVVGYENEKYIKGIVKSIETGFNADILKRYNINNDNNLILYDLLSYKIKNTIYKSKFEKSLFA